jgi:hypothetical protein
MPYTEVKVQTFAALPLCRFAALPLCRYPSKGYGKP